MSYDINQMRPRLEARLKVLQERVAEIDATLRQPEDEDVEEQAVDLEDDEVLERLSRAGREELHLIRDALKRMSEGTYGKCLSCGEKISERRLKALPEASTCLRCAQRSGE